MRDKVQSRRVFVHGIQNIPTPKWAVELLKNHGGPLYEVVAPEDHSMYGLPVAPMMPASGAK